jgi:threonine dehydratase
MLPTSGEAIPWLEGEGWDVVSESPFEARRERGERVEVLRAGPDGRVRYTLTRAVGDEEFRRVQEGDVSCRVVTRSYRETTVIAEAGGGSLLATMQAVLQAART